MLSPDGPSIKIPEKEKKKTIEGHKKASKVALSGADARVGKRQELEG